MAPSNLTTMSQEAPKPADLSALRIRREPERPSGTRGWLLVAAVLVVAAGAAAFLLAGRGIRPRKVETVTASVVTEGQATTVLSATGYVEAERKADLSPKITSRITALNVTEGTRVKKGDVIARLDSTDLDAQLAEAKANWVNAKAERARQKASSTRASRRSRRSTRPSPPRPRRGPGCGTCDALLDYTIIRAPFAGVITAKRAFVGEAVSPFGSSPSGGGSGGAIVTIVEFSSLYVGADVNEANLSKLGKDQPAEITLDAVPDKVYHGRLRQIVPAADRQKATVRVKVAFLDADDRILPDLSARVAFTSAPTQGKAARSRVLVPKSALTTVDGRTGVFRVVDGRASFTPVDGGRRRAGPGGSEAGPPGRRAADRPRGGGHDQGRREGSCRRTGELKCQRR